MIAIAVGCDQLVDTHPPSGNVVWKSSLESTARSGPPAADGRRIYVVTAGRVSAYGSEDGTLEWWAPFEVYAPSNVVVEDDRAFAAESSAFAFDAATGDVIWRFTPDANASLGESAVHAGAFYFGTASHRVYALSVATGDVLWNTDVGVGWEHKGVVKGIALSGDTTYANVEQWLAHNGYISRGWIVALDSRTGRILWRYQNGGNNEFRNFARSPVVAGRLVIASDRRSNAVIAVDRFTGTEVWRVNGDPLFIGFTDPPVVVGDTVYAASGDMHVYALDLNSGDVLWKTKTPAANTSLAVCGDRVFANYQGLAVIDRHTGQLLERSYEGGEFLISAFAVYDDLFFVAGNDSLYAFRCNWE